VLGEINPETTENYAHIGEVLMETGQYDAVLQVQRRVLAVREQTMGRTYPEIGVVLYEQGKYDDALEAHRKH